jgi:hypothetical protein
MVFHTDSAVDFGFAGISDTVSDVSMTISVTVRGGIQIFTLIHFNTPFSSCFTKSRGNSRNQDFKSLHETLGGFTRLHKTSKDFMRLIIFHETSRMNSLLSPPCQKWCGLNSYYLSLYSSTEHYKGYQLFIVYNIFKETIRLASKSFHMIFKNTVPIQIHAN